MLCIPGAVPMAVHVSPEELMTYLQKSLCGALLCPDDGQSLQAFGPDDGQSLQAFGPDSRGEWNRFLYVSHYLPLSKSTFDLEQSH